jgi:hypothetical protein
LIPRDFRSSKDAANTAKAEKGSLVSGTIFPHHLFVIEPEFVVAEPAFVAPAEGFVANFGNGGAIIRFRTKNPISAAIAITNERALRPGLRVASPCSDMRGKMAFCQKQSNRDKPERKNGTKPL